MELEPDLGLESLFDRSLDHFGSHFGFILSPKTDLKTIVICHAFLDGPLGGGGGAAIPSEFSSIQLEGWGVLGEVPPTLVGANLAARMLTRPFRPAATKSSQFLSSQKSPVKSTQSPPKSTQVGPKSPKVDQKGSQSRSTIDLEIL